MFSCQSCSFGQVQEESVEEILKSVCPAVEEEPKPTGLASLLAGLPWWSWLLIAGALVYMLSEKKKEVKKGGVRQSVYEQ